MKTYKAFSDREGSIGSLIRNARTRAGISQAALGRRSGTGQAAISRIERGLERPTMERAEQILAGLGWRLEYGLAAIAPHDAEPRRILEAQNLPPDERLEAGLSLARFARSLDQAAASRDE